MIHNGIEYDLMQAWQKVVKRNEWKRFFESLKLNGIKGVMPSFVETLLIFKQLYR
jgi:6-phosphogluconate dehydrogenase (decarboxylating)